MVCSYVGPYWCYLVALQWYIGKCYGSKRLRPASRLGTLVGGVVWQTQRSACGKERCRGHAPAPHTTGGVGVKRAVGAWSSCGVVPADEWSCSCALRYRMEMLKKLDASDNLTQLIVAAVVIAGCTLVARLFDDRKSPSLASPPITKASAASPVSPGPMQICIEGLPDNPPRALAGALKATMGLEATPVVVSTGPRAVVRLGTMNDLRKCSPQTANVMVSAALPVASILPDSPTPICYERKLLICMLYLVIVPSTQYSSVSTLHTR